MLNIFFIYKSFSLDKLSSNKTAILFLLCGLLVFTDLNSQQNLIVNGDCEAFSNCPLGFSDPTQINKEITKCLGWNTPTYGTSDYFNYCSTSSDVGIPVNACGDQPAFNGNGYLGALFSAYTWGSGSDGYNGIMWWEYIQGTLIQPLESGKVYKLTMEISLAELSDLMIPEIGAHFSIDPISTLNTAALQLNPQCVFYNSNYFNDTLNWMHIEAYFLANGGEKYVTIGNFKDNITTDTLRRYSYSQFDLNPFKTYMFIDNVILTKAFDFIEFPNCFSPNGDGINDVWTLPFNEGPGNHTVIIANRWGNIIYESDLNNFQWTGLDSNSEICHDGTYFYRITNTKIAGFIELMK